MQTIKTVFAVTALFAVTACSNTMHGFIDDFADNGHKTIEFTGDAVIKIVDWSGNAVSTIGEDAVKSGYEIGKDTKLPDVPNTSKGKSTL